MLKFMNVLAWRNELVICVFGYMDVIFQVRSKNSPLDYWAVSVKCLNSIGNFSTPNVERDPKI